MRGGTEAFDAAEREMWEGRAEVYAGSFARLCARPVGALLDAGGVGAGTRVLDVGTGTGAVALAGAEPAGLVLSEGPARVQPESAPPRAGRDTEACARPAIDRLVAAESSREVGESGGAVYDVCGRDAGA